MKDDVFKKLQSNDPTPLHTLIEGVKPMKELKEGQEVTINIPFTYTIGEEAPHTGEILKTVQDCEDEVRSELEELPLHDLRFTHLIH